MEVKRKPFQGVLNILSFNRHFYIIGILVCLIILAAINYFNLPPIVFWLTVIAFSYGFLAPLLVSAYVYDFSGYYNLNWLQGHTPDTGKINFVVNINAGFDETSFILKHKLPAAELRVFDFYDKKQHTEPAIVRARKVSLTYPNTQQISTKAIPLNDNCTDYVFLLSAAHEIRSHEEKVQFLKECHRICKPNGKVIMVEHLRDFPNFLAFSIGFTHFFSKATWQNAFNQAGFTDVQEIKFTPFMSVFNCSRK